jgi:hypothetical protein
MIAASGRPRPDAAFPKLANWAAPSPQLWRYRAPNPGALLFLGQMPLLRASRYEAAVRRIHGHSDPVDPFNFFSASTRMLRKSSSVANHFSSSRESGPAALRALMRICVAMLEHCPIGVIPEGIRIRGVICIYLFRDIDADDIFAFSTDLTGQIFRQSRKPRIGCFKRR